MYVLIHTYMYLLYNTYIHVCTGVLYVLYMSKWSLQYIYIYILLFKQLLGLYASQTSYNLLLLHYFINPSIVRSQATGVTKLTRLWCRKSEIAIRMTTERPPRSVINICIVPNNLFSQTPNKQIGIVLVYIDRSYASKTVSGLCAFPFVS